MRAAHKSSSVVGRRPARSTIATLFVLEMISAFAAGLAAPFVGAWAYEQASAKEHRKAKAEVGLLLLPGAGAASPRPAGACVALRSSF